MKYLAWFAAASIAFLPSVSASAATTYTYDNLGRVSTVSYDNGLKITYTYDPAGNRTAVTTQSGP